MRGTKQTVQNMPHLALSCVSALLLARHLQQRRKLSGNGLVMRAELTKETKKHTCLVTAAATAGATAVATPTCRWFYVYARMWPLLSCVQHFQLPPLLLLLLLPHARCMMVQRCCLFFFCHCIGGGPWSL